MLRISFHEFFSWLTLYNNFHNRHTHTHTHTYIYFLYKNISIHAGSLSLSMVLNFYGFDTSKCSSSVSSPQFHYEPVLSWLNFLKNNKRFIRFLRVMFLTLRGIYNYAESRGSDIIRFFSFFFVVAK